jgi:hypothetical protein
VDDRSRQPVETLKGFPDQLLARLRQDHHRHVAGNQLLGRENSHELELRLCRGRKAGLDPFQADAVRQYIEPASLAVHVHRRVATFLCAAGDGGGNILTSSDPSGSNFAETNAGGSVQITGVTCPTATNCVAVDNNADVVTSTDPGGGPAAWTFENLVPFEAESADHGQFVKNALWGASCVSTSLCVLVGANSRIFSATDPFAAPAPSSGGGKATRKRPRTHLVFAEGFWKSAVTRHRRFKARFHFYSRDGARRFECRRDHARWRLCHSPLRYWVTVGHHALRVRAIGPTGLRGPAAALRFKVVRWRPR